MLRTFVLPFTLFSIIAATSVRAQGQHAEDAIRAVVSAQVIAWDPRTVMHMRRILPQTRRLPISLEW